MRYPGYTFGNTIFSVINMSSVILVALAILLIIIGAILSNYYVAGFGVFILALQIKSRYRFVRDIRKLREVDGRLEALVSESRGWVSVDGLKRIAITNFPYADPWRPITLGYPGLILKIDGVDEDVEVLFAYGLDLARDDVAEMLVKRYPAAVMEKE